MGIHKLVNEEIAIEVNDLGAELYCLADVKNGTKYLWNGDKEYWGRRAPILFPFVGNCKNKEYSYHGTKYPMSSHGFARDMDFTMIEKTKTMICHSLVSNEETRRKYPFDFRLIVRHRLQGRSLIVEWEVVNEDAKRMFFSIGGHPGFFCPSNGKESLFDSYIIFDTTKPLICKKVSENGLLLEMEKEIQTENGYLPVSEHLFDEDALVFEENQAHHVSFANKDKKPYLTVSFDAPLFGVWSPPKKNAPFICVEPWYGRCDRELFNGTLEEREWEQNLLPSEKFIKSYIITV